MISKDNAIWDSESPIFSVKCIAPEQQVNVISYAEHNFYHPVVDWLDYFRISWRLVVTGTLFGKQYPKSLHTMQVSFILSLPRFLQCFCFYFYLFYQLFFIISCCIFWPASGFCALQALVKICFFHNFGIKKLKKGTKSKKMETKFSEEMCFWRLHPYACQWFKKQILTSIWSAQWSNAGHNIQQSLSHWIFSKKTNIAKEFKSCETLV